MTKRKSQPTGRPATLLATACVLTLSLAACSEAPTSPPPAAVQSPAPSLASGRARAASKAERYKKYLSGGAYAALFGRRQGGSAHALGFPHRGRRGKIADLADVLVNDRGQPGLGQSEVTIAEHGGTIVVGYNDAAGFEDFNEGLTGWAISHNRGRSFLDGGGLPHMASSGFIHFGDPGLAADNGGTFYFTDLCFDFNTDPVLSGICLTTGRRHGQTIDWGTPIYVVSTLPEFLDKPFIAVDPQGRDVYVSYTRFSDELPCGQIEVIASHNGGQSFGGPVVVQPGENCVVNQGSEPAIGPNGQVYITFERDWLTSLTPRIMASRSLDAGASFSPPAVVHTITSIAFNPPSGYNRETINDYPRIAAAITGPFRGGVYITYHDASSGAPDVFVSRSSDGLSWSGPVRVNHATADYQFFPAVAVEPSGNVDVMWYDRSLNPGTALTNTFWGQSTDGGRTFDRNARVSDVATDWLATVSDIAPNFGDYNDIAAGGNRAYVAWGDGRFGDPDVFFSEVRGAGRSPNLALAH
jgi:hypothetical protein